MAKKGARKNTYMSKIRGLTEQKLIRMPTDELIDLIRSTSKTIRAGIREVQKTYGEESPFISRRLQNKYELPKEYKVKSLMKKTRGDLEQISRDLAYTSRLKTVTKSGMEEYAKDFEEKTGKSLKDLDSKDWELLRLLMEEGGYDSTSVIEAYDIESGDIENLDELELANEQAKLNVEEDMDVEAPYNL